MPKFYRVRFYSDITRHDETRPCAVHSRAYPSLPEAEKAANNAMMLMRGMYGTDTGYLVEDAKGDAVAVGPLTYEK